MRNRLQTLFVIATVALFAASAFAQESRPSPAPDLADEELSEEDGSGEGDDVQERAFNPNTTGTEEVQPTGPRSVGEGTSSGDQDGDGGNNGTGGN